MKFPREGRSRVVISDLSPQIEDGYYPVKRVPQEPLSVEVNLVADGHDQLTGCLEYRFGSARKWEKVPLQALGNDRYCASFAPTDVGHYQYRIKAWINYALTWLLQVKKKYQAGQEIALALAEGEAYLHDSRHPLAKKALKAGLENMEEVLPLLLDPALEEAFTHQLQPTFPSSTKRYLLWCDAPKARFSTWYELFPRSTGAAGQHGTFKDVLNQLPRIADLGFDVLYLPPIHPIGRLNRKGKNNSTQAEPDDVGSPWGIGAEEGGHLAVHPALGTLQDYHKLIKAARQQYGIEVAMDLAFQCAPDHPWVKQFPQWFKWRSDGTVQYAENPPKKYQDILPIYFETEDWQNLWKTLLEVIFYWIEQGITIFRVDNPHTKALPFWAWAMAQVHAKKPEVVFLAEAFTRPVLMHNLARAGFQQSYTYFTWRNFRHELEAYMEELTHGPGAEYFRPNFWPNTPDILPYPLQSGHEPLFLIRLFLAGTLSSNYGVYGPAYENLIHAAVPGKEEYLHSEKYQCYDWDWNVENKVTWLMKRLNQARHQHPALQQTRQFRHLDLENQALYAYFKWNGPDKVLMVCSLDPHKPQEGTVQLPLDLISLDRGPILLTDLLTEEQYHWEAEWNYVRLDPAHPYHLFHLKEA